MSKIPLILNFGLFCFCLTGPAPNWLTVFVALGLGWNAGLSYAAFKVDETDRLS